jgi:VanZ family protein
VTAAPPAAALFRRARLARAAYAAIILLATLAGLEPELGVAGAAGRLARFFDLGLAARDVVDGARNLALFAGWGVVWIVTAPGTRLLRRTRDAALTGAALSAVVEALQLFSPVRIASVLDVLTNAAGALAGAAVTVAIARALDAGRGRRSFLGMPAWVFAAGTAAAAALEAFTPLFRAASVPGSGGPLSRLLSALAVFEWRSFAALPLFDFVLFAPAGAFAVAAVVEAGSPYDRAARRVAAAGVAGFVAIQLLRGASSQPIVGGAAVVHAAAVAAGALAAARWLPPATQRLRGPARPAALLAAYAAWFGLWVWRPFLPELSGAAIAAQLTADRLVPLSAHAMRFDLFSVADVVRQFCLLAPAGALLAVWPLRTTGPLRGPLPAVYGAFAFEAGQILVAGRLFDITDALVGAAGAAIGWVVVRRCGYPVHGELAAAPRGGSAGGRAPGRRA